jgi:hypothetical protein
MAPRIVDNRDAVDPPTLTFDTKSAAPRTPKVIGATKALVRTVAEEAETLKKNG